MKLLLAFLLLGTSVSQAEQCYSKFNHKMQEGPALKKGKLAGNCIQISLAMPVTLYARDDARDTWVLKNVMSEKQHGYLVIHPQADFVRTIFEKELFTPKWAAAHTQMRFNFKNNSLHWYKTAKDAMADAFFLPGKATPDSAFSDFVLSIEAIGDEGYEYGLLKGQEDYFALVYRAVRLEDKVQHMITEGHDTVKQWVLDLSREGDVEASKQFSIAYMARFLKRSQDIGLTKMYNTLNVNCTNELFRTLNEILEGKVFTKTDIAISSIPIWSNKILKRKNLFQSQEIDLNEEVHSIWK